MQENTMFCLYLISGCVSDSLSVTLSFWIVLSSLCCKTRWLIIFSLNVRSGRRCFVCYLCQEQLDCLMKASCLSLSLRTGYELFDQDNKVVSNLTGEQKSSRICVSCPDLPAWIRYWACRVTVVGINSVWGTNTDILICDVIHLLSKGKVF